MKLGEGSLLGPYRVIGELGRGGMATVYKGHQNSLSRYVAIKVLPEFFAEEPGFRERFKQEAVSVANLRHPNILAVFDYGEQDGITYIVTEFVDGGTLAEQFGKALPVDYITTVLEPIAAALDYAHRREVLHRDIKPSNVLLETDGTPILSDFGLARMMTSKAERLTQSGMIVGTPEYMSPEQCQGVELDAAADQYSLAVVAYEGLTGRVPFSAETPVAVIMAQIGNELPPPRVANPDLSEAVQGALLKALAKNPKDRYKSCVSFIRALAAAEHPTPPTDRTMVVGMREPAGPPTIVEAAPAPAESHAPLPSTAPPPPYLPPPPPQGYQTPAPAPSHAPQSYQQPYPTPTPAKGGFRPAPGGQGYPQQQPPQPPAGYRSPPPPGYTSDFQPAAQSPWSSDALRVSHGIPGWVTALLIIGAIAAGLWGLFSILAYAYPTGAQDSSYFGVLAIFAVASLAVVLASLVAVVGIIQARTWARTMTIVAAIVLGLTCVGLVLAIPIGVGVARSR